MNDDDFFEIELDLDPKDRKPREVPPHVQERRRLEARIAELEAQLGSMPDGRVPTMTVEPKERHDYDCGFHPRINVSQRTAKVTCAICGEELDPLDVLRQYSRAERNFAYQLEHLRKEARDLRVEIEDLKRQRTNLRAQIRRGTR